MSEPFNFEDCNQCFTRYNDCRKTQQSVQGRNQVCYANSGCSSGMCQCCLRAVPPQADPKIWCPQNMDKVQDICTQGARELSGNVIFG